MEKVGENIGRLALTVKSGESLLISLDNGESIEIRVTEVLRRDRVSVKIVAPKRFAISRKK